MRVKRTWWTDAEVEDALRKTIGMLSLERMPTASEVKGAGRTDLHNRIVRSSTYREWADKLGVPMKNNHVNFAQEAEIQIAEVLRGRGHTVEQMVSKHPYDLLVDGAVKVDVKVASGYVHRRSIAHSFSLDKVEQTSDIYVLIARGSNNTPDRTFVIPSHVVKQITVGIGAKSKYDIYKGRLDIIRKYSEFFRGHVI